jgi:chromatin licensing and DNA replication factor 1
MLELRRKIEKFNQALILNENGSITEDDNKKVEEKPTKPVETKKVSSYLKHNDLASATIDHSCTLTLPKHYAQLLESFKGSETIIKFLNNRQEICTFLKLKLAIQNLTKHNFTLCHLSQIKTVYPQAYLYKQEKMFIDFKNDYHLIVLPNMEGKFIH